MNTAAESLLGLVALGVVGSDSLVYITPSGADVSNNLAGPLVVVRKDFSLPCTNICGELSG